MHIEVKDTPKHIESPNSEVCDFIDQYACVHYQLMMNAN